MRNGPSAANLTLHSPMLVIRLYRREFAATAERMLEEPSHVFSPNGVGEGGVR